MVHHPSYTTYDSYDHVDADGGEITFPQAISLNACPICNGRFIDLEHQKGSTIVLGLSLCSLCGWWHLHQDFENQILDRETGNLSGVRQWARWWELHHAAIGRIDFADGSITIDELRAHLARYWDRHREMSAQQAEDLIASVLREREGGDVLRFSANASAADGGIDLYLVTRSGVLTRGIQVKRRLTRNVEGVKDVRNFVGAMLLEGLETGTFVTTASRFTKPAKQVSDNANLSRARLSLELIDGEQLVELLQHSALAGAVDLPPPMTLDQQWTATDGTLFHARELLLGDIRRLARSARPVGQRPPISRASARYPAA